MLKLIDNIYDNKCVGCQIKKAVCGQVTREHRVVVECLVDSGGVECDQLSLHEKSYGR